MYSISSNARLTNGGNPQADLANKSVLEINVEKAQELTINATKVHLHLVGITSKIVSILI